ncbi:hypothetical protein [Streptomyces monomycini]|uniref:hypothetical protein n=1 Tax=Streptomyces monomycini TaxID=371720 RepID=UPI001EEB297C|nr:hypothetical protein [Streptomyces monomycini]
MRGSDAAAGHAGQEPGAAPPDPMRVLLTRLITDGAHHARCAKHGRERRRPTECIAVQQGFAAGCCLAASYVADLVVSGQLRSRGGHRVPDADEDAAVRVADGLADTPQGRARQIVDAIYGGGLDRAVGESR